MRKLFLLTFIFLFSCVLMACSNTANNLNENENANEATQTDNANQAENDNQSDSNNQSDDAVDFFADLPDEFPDDFPFPDSTTLVQVNSIAMGDVLRYTLALGHNEGEAELENTLITYLESKGCDLEEVSGDYICLSGGEGVFEEMKIHVEDEIASISFSVPQ